jgi:hypothetical protein
MVSTTKRSSLSSINKWSHQIKKVTFWQVDKTIKLWKVYEKSIKVVAENNLNDSNGLVPRSPTHPSLSGFNNGISTTTSLDRSSGIVNTPHFTPQTLRLPRMTHHETIVTATPRRVFQNAHAYHINSISVNSDAETFISADDLRINLWNLNIPDQSFSNISRYLWLTCIDIVDIKPVNMEELTEVITAAEFHPIHCNYFAYSSSKGTIKLADMRESALCDHHAKRNPPYPFQPVLMCSFRSRRRPRFKILFLRNHFLSLRYTFLKRRSIRPFQRLSHSQNMGFSNGRTYPFTNHQHSWSFTT